MKKQIYNPFSLFSRFEWGLWLLSCLIAVVSFIVSEQKDVFNLITTLVGTTSLVFLAKGHVLGQFLMVLFSLLYAIISFTFRYYGEMITYLGMTAPISLFTAVVWLRHPYERAVGEVKTANLTKRSMLWLMLFSVLVTVAFYFILQFFGNNSLLISTVSVFTSFLASALMLLRSPYYALAYAANDLVLIVLWILATVQSDEYLPMVFCFAMFLINDLYGFFNWQRMRLRQDRKE